MAGIKTKPVSKFGQLLRGAYTRRKNEREFTSVPKIPAANQVINDFIRGKPPVKSKA